MHNERLFCKTVLKIRNKQGITRNGIGLSNYRLIPEGIPKYPLNIHYTTEI